MDKLIFSGKAIDSQLTEIISAGGRICLVVTGTSMRPFLKHGRDMVCLRAWEEKDIKRGQVLLFQRRDRSFVLHRIRKVLSDGKLLMNGDGQVCRETISQDQVVAVVSSIERKGRHISCDHMWFRLWNWIWYPTRPFRSIIFRLWNILSFRGVQYHGSSG